MTGQRPLEKYKKRLNQLDREFETYKYQFRDITDYTLPTKSRYLSGDSLSQNNDGTRKDQRIINGTAAEAITILGAGMQGGMTSPSRPWFLLTLNDEELVEFAPVREWLHDVRNLMLAVFSRSNLYGVLHALYMELGNYSTAAMLIEEDFKTVIRSRSFTIGEYRLAANEDNIIDSLYRTFAMTAQQMVDKFGEKNVSDIVKYAVKNNQGEQLVNVCHCIQPNRDINLNKIDAKGMQYESVYWEKNGSDDKILFKGGYREKPFVAPRWDVTGSDTYGSNCPGMKALGDNKMLQKMEEKKLKALDKMIDPPLNADSSLAKKGGTIIAGGVNYIDGLSQGRQGFSPVYEIRPDMQNIAFEIDRVEQRIKRQYFVDLFLSIIGTDKRMTATEVAERHEEKLLMLGPVLERLQSELLDVIIDRTFNIMQDMGILPPIPKELEGRTIKTEYISLLAQAQKLVGTTAVEQTVRFIGGLAGMNPETIDKLDFDETVDQYASMVGVPPKMIRSDDNVRILRIERQQAQQAAMQQAQMSEMIDKAKTLSDTEVDKNSALDALLAGAI